MSLDILRAQLSTCTPLPEEREPWIYCDTCDILANPSLHDCRKTALGRRNRAFGELRYAAAYRLALQLDTQFPWPFPEPKPDWKANAFRCVQNARLATHRPSFPLLPA